MNNQQNTFRPYANDCFGALCPWWLPAQDPSGDTEPGLQDTNVVGCVGDCVEVIGENSDDNESSPVHENGAFPKTRYHVEGKPTGISVLQARKSFLKKQLRTKGIKALPTNYFPY